VEWQKKTVTYHRKFMTGWPQRVALWDLAIERARGYTPPIMKPTDFIPFSLLQFRYFDPTPALIFSLSPCTTKIGYFTEGHLRNMSKYAGRWDPAAN